MDPGGSKMAGEWVGALWRKEQAKLRASKTCPFKTIPLAKSASFASSIHLVSTGRVQMMEHQRRAGGGPVAAPTAESAIDVEDTMHLSPSDFQIQGHVPGEMLAHASRMGTSDVAFLDALKAVNQAVSNMTQMTQGAASTMPVNPPKPQLRFCPSCGAKVLSQAHRFCAYCCFPFGQLQDETVPPPAQQTSLLSSSPMPSSMGAVEQALLANMQAAAPMASQPVMPGKVSKTSKANKSPQPDNGNLLSNLRHFRYMEANQLDVELARVLCLTHIRDSIQVAVEGKFRLPSLSALSEKCDKQAKAQIGQKPAEHEARPASAKDALKASVPENAEALKAQSRMQENVRAKAFDCSKPPTCQKAVPTVTPKRETRRGLLGWLVPFRGFFGGDEDEESKHHSAECRPCRVASVLPAKVAPRATRHCRLLQQDYLEDCEEESVMEDDEPDDLLPSPPEAKRRRLMGWIPWRFNLHMSQWHSVAATFKLVGSCWKGAGHWDHECHQETFWPAQFCAIGTQSCALNSMSFTEQKPCGCTVLLLGLLRAGNHWKATQLGEQELMRGK
eukprot:s597_g24.t1